MRCAVLTCSSEAVCRARQVSLEFDDGELVFELEDDLGFCAGHGRDDDLHDLAVSVLAAVQRCGRRLGENVDPFRLRSYRIGFWDGQERSFGVSPGGQA